MEHRNMRSKRYWLTDNKDNKDNILLNGKDMMQAITLGNQPETSSMQKNPSKSTKDNEIYELFLVYLFILYTYVIPFWFLLNFNTCTKQRELGRPN